MVFEASNTKKAKPFSNFLLAIDKNSVLTFTKNC